MTILLLVIAIVLVGGTILLALGRVLPRPVVRRSKGGSESGGRPGSAGGTVREGMTIPVAQLPPVLLPDVPSARDVDALRFGLGFRGYRVDQVDEVLDRLAAALQERDATIGDLQRQRESELLERPPRT